MERSLMPGCLKTVRPSSVRSVHTMRIIRTPIRMDMVPLYLVGQLLCNIWLKGDKYEVWIPQQLAYGASDNGDIPAYSTLIFEIELVSVDEQAASAS